MFDLIKDIIQAFFQGFLSGISDLFNWTKDPREAPAEKEDTSWQKFFKYKEWRIFAIQEVTAQIVVVLILLIVIREAVGEFRFIPSESMEPTMIVGDKLFVEKFSKRFQSKFQRGDIVIFYPPKEATEGEDVISYDPFSVFARLTGLPFLPQPEAYIKRVVGLPGETIEIRENQGVFINGILLDEPYHEGSVEFLPDYSLPETEIPEDSYFVLGDNRNYSYDSHAWGPLPKSRIIGRAAALIFRSLDEKPKLMM